MAIATLVILVVLNVPLYVLIGWLHAYPGCAGEGMPPGPNPL